MLRGQGDSIPRKVDSLYTLSLHSVESYPLEDLRAVKKSILMVWAVALPFCAPIVYAAPINPAPREMVRPQSPAWTLPIVKRDSLLNGLQLGVIEQPGTGTFTAKLRLAGGALFDLAGKGGLAEITAGMLLRGSRGGDAKHLAETVEATGLRINVIAKWDSTNITISGPSESFDTAIDLLGRLVTSPTFDQKELDALKSQRVAALKQIASDKEILEQTAVQTVFGSHPFGKPLYGTADSVANITRQDVVYFHNRFYLANSSFLIVTGDVSAEQVTRSARSRLGSWKKGEIVPAMFRPPDAISSRRVLLLERAGADEANAILAQVGFSRRADDYYPALIMFDLLEQRLKGLATPNRAIELRHETTLIAGPMMVDVKTGSETLVESVSAVVAEMDALDAGKFTPEQVEAARSRVTSKFAERLRTTEGAVELLLDIEHYGLGRDYLVNFVERVNAVTAADVQRAAARYVNPQSIAVVVSGPASRIEEGLKRLGAVTVRK